ncbi:hypothetical protein NKI36_14815 [Mesorhizobium caraganae]|uniref:Uncharacterized protein n=1 Tax=Mesorhizobium caraganae TaxID=483206 RepID=A0ABV1YZY7_9HYPH
MPVRAAIVGSSEKSAEIIEEHRRRAKPPNESAEFCRPVHLIRSRGRNTKMESQMGFFGKYFSGLLGKKSTDGKGSGDMRKATGAGPALAAHSKDAKTSAPTGQSTKASSKNADGR